MLCYVLSSQLFYFASTRASLLHNETDARQERLILEKLGSIDDIWWIAWRSERRERKTRWKSHVVSWSGLFCLALLFFITMKLIALAMKGAIFFVSKWYKCLSFVSCVLLAASGWALLRYLTVDLHDYHSVHKLPCSELSSFLPDVYDVNGVASFTNQNKLILWKDSKSYISNLRLSRINL